MQAADPHLSYDIFCTVVDNYGDIGVCWRLARQLAARPDCGPIRLWVDNLESFSRIASDIHPQAQRQVRQNVEVRRWVPAAVLDEEVTPADVMIEAFACPPPASYIARMSDAQLWINLEYLSAEPWVESCHGLPSLQANGLRKHFFFPGFTERTGGLLRERDLTTQRDAWRADPDSRFGLLAQLGVNVEWLDRLYAGARLVYVYCYPQAPLPALMEALASAGRDTLVLIPQGIWPGTLPGLVRTADCQVAMHAHPFVDQDIFDRLLWSSDLNVVRGEDSLIRAIWAGRPMIWQPYLQAEDAHLDKLAAWLEISPYPSDIQNAMRAWNQGEPERAFTELAPLLTPPRLAAWKDVAKQWSDALLAQDDLATRLVRFCAEQSQTR